MKKNKKLKSANKFLQAALADCSNHNRQQARTIKHLENAIDRLNHRLFVIQKSNEEQSELVTLQREALEKSADEFSNLKQAYEELKKQAEANTLKSIIRNG